MSRFLTMFEVSQKQAYIFNSNKLKDNIVNSATIAWIMSPDYFEEIIGDRSVFSSEKNLVYAGGGHIVLEFEDRDTAINFSKTITLSVHKDYPDIELFVTTMEYDPEMTPGKNMKNLTDQLERKKSLRNSAFHQGTFGIEKMDVNTGKPCQGDGTREVKMPDTEEKTDMELFPKGYQRVDKFEDLGGTKNENNFIAVIHIDGNAMGKRVENLIGKNGESSWEEYRKTMQIFSSSVDQDFKDAYKEMNGQVARNIASGKLDVLNLNHSRFPVRRIITAGDDICFVTEGRIGIECAVSFIKALNKKKNAVDGEGYSACGGIAIVHQKYPFYKAYETAELLCSNAKKFGASLSKDGTGRDISAIDWHIEFGEMKDTLEEIREDYETFDGKRLELRPYIVAATDEINKKEPVRNYANFRKLITKIQSNEIAYARSKMKELRSVLKRGEESARYYLKFNKIEDLSLESYQGIYEKVSMDQIGSGKGLRREVFIKTADGVDRSLLFDALEISDTYIDLDD